MLSIQKAIRSVVVGAMLARERWQSGVAYNPLSKQTAQDPYPVYAALRDRDPVHRSALMNAWMFTRHADIDTILRDHRRFSNDPRKGTLSSRQRAGLPADEEFTMLFLDPPDHKRLRALVNKAFTPKAVNALEPHIRSLLGTLLDEIDDPAGFDLMQAVAQPLPRDRDRRDARRAAGGQGPVQDLVGPARAYAGAVDRRARARACRCGQQVAQRLLPADHRGAPRGTSGRHRERARAGGRRRRPPHRA